MKKRESVKSILANEHSGYRTTVKGWVRTFRNNQFIALNDGSTVKPIQIVLDFKNFPEDLLRKITPGAAIGATGKIIPSGGRGQRVELVAEEIEIYGEADPSSYPLQPKRHSLEFLRSISHLRIKTNTFGCVFRLRHALAFAIHKYFNDKGFFYMHTPIITGSDAEGAGEMFHVSTLDPKSPPLTEMGEIDWSKDFFGKQTNLTVSGQLEAELGAMALDKVYTFGPTFRAENSHTTRHLAEFWMIEPEIAFADIHDDMDLAEDMLKYLIGYVLENNREDLEFLQNRLLQEEKSLPQNKRSEMALIEKLEFVLAQDFERISYTQAFEILRNSKPNKKKRFKYPISDWGADFQSEHERYLVEKHFKKPVIITDYPAKIKAFYMYLNEDGKTVRGMDILFPQLGEIVGGSERETRMEVLEKRMTEFDIPPEELQWYLDIRKWGSCPHAGFGLGFGRLVQFITGMGNIRDVIPFPRYPGYAEF